MRPYHLDHTGVPSACGEIREETCLCAEQVETETGSSLSFTLNRVKIK